MRFIDLFAGIGGFRRGMEQAGHTCAGFCEIDRHAVASYTSMHLITEGQREKLSRIEDIRDRQKEILKEEYRNGEWHASDISRIRAGDIPAADCWCFGFPCQDISTAGKMAGLSGRRSGLFYAVTGIIADTPEKNKPAFLFIENVKNLLSINRGYDFLSVLAELDKIGYDAEWCVVNSTDHGVPQHRERVFIIGHFRGRSTRQVFPLCGAGGIPPDPEETGKVRETAYCLTAGGNEKRNGSYIVYRKTIPVQTVNLINKGQNGRGYKADGDPMYTLTAKDVHGIYDGDKIRRLTPRECFRLQGWEDLYFDRAALVNTDRELYHQAGNGVTVPVIRCIAQRLKMEDESWQSQKS